MLLPKNSRKRLSLGLGGEPVPCVQCDRREVGLAWGDFCSECQRERERRAARIGQRYAIIGAVGVALWLYRAMGPLPLQRVFGAASILLVYVIIKRFVSRIVLERLPKRVKRVEGGGSP